MGNIDNIKNLRRFLEGGKIDRKDVLYVVSRLEESTLSESEISILKEAMINEGARCKSLSETCKDDRYYDTFKSLVSKLEKLYCIQL